MANEQKRLAAFWTSKCKSLDVLIADLGDKLNSHQYSAVKKAIDDLLLEWKEFEELHNKYITGINERDRLQFVQERYTGLKREITIVTSECESRLQYLDTTLKYAMETGMESGLPVRPDPQDDKSSVLSGVSRVSKSSSVSPVSVRKRALKKSLVAKLKLEQARKRAEAAKVAYEQSAKMELSKLEDEASVAELEWRIECGFNEKTGLVTGLDDSILIPPISVKENSHVTPSSDLSDDKFKFTDQGIDKSDTEIKQQTFPSLTAIECASNSRSSSVVTPQVTYAGCFASNVVPQYTPISMSQAPSVIDSTVHVVSSQVTPVVVSQASSVAVSQYKPINIPQAAPPHVSTVEVVSSPLTPVVTPWATQPGYSISYPVPSQSTPKFLPQGYHASSGSKSEYLTQQQTTDTNTESVPRDHVAAMWKIQMLNGIKPTQFNGNPADFPFFREQIRTHLESEFLTDAQRLEYLPKFVTGEALDVVKRNRGCSFSDVIKTLEERYGQTIRVTQACIEELVSGPKLTYGDNVALLNFSERLNTATKILKGNVEREASVATNLKRIIERLPYDLVRKWQTVNYEITQQGKTACLKDIADFVKKQAAIRNDPVYGIQGARRDKDNKDGKGASKPVKNKENSVRASTISAINVNNIGDESKGAEICKICKSRRHKFQNCSVIQQCDIVAVRKQYALSYGYCFNCGLEKPGHGSTSCPEPPACTKCAGRHLTLLHVDSSNSNKHGSHQTNVTKGKGKLASHLASINSSSENKIQGVNSVPNEHKVSVSSAAVSTEQPRVLLNVVPVTITADNGRSASTYAFLDSGCTDTLIDKALAEYLGMQGEHEQIGICTITDKDNVVDSERISFTLSPVDGSGEMICVDEGYILPDLNQSKRVLPETLDMKPYPHLQDIDFPPVEVKRVSILVGNNLPFAHIQQETRVPESQKGLYGCRYPLGWCVSGPCNKVNSNRRVSMNSVSVDSKHDLIERFWKLEDYGASALKPEGGPLSVEDIRAQRIIKETTRLTTDGHYEVGLLWRDDNPSLPNNRPMAEKRAESLRRRLTKPGNEVLAAKYREVMEGYIEKGYARKLTEEELEHESPVTWFLPNHPVMTANKPGKLRIVFDAAAEFEGASLNKALLSGPDVTNSLVAVLLRFRQGNVGLAADVEAMFLQIRVRKEDQPALRFLWWTKSYDESPDVYTMQVHIFGAASSPCIANSTLQRVADDNAEDFSVKAVDTVRHNFYVDDALPSTDDESSGVQLASDMVKLLERGGFRLRKFSSNSKEVLASLPSSERAKPDLDLDFDDLPVERALGLRWYAETDELGFEIRSLNRADTKRGILSTVCSLYDPLGFAVPVAMTARNLIQELWKAQVDWDQPLDDHFIEKWHSWKGQLPLLTSVRIPRCYFPPSVNPARCMLQLHVFCDASEVGFGTCAYLRVGCPDGTTHCSFVMGKGRNAPAKFTSIPRLELQAAVLATRLGKMLNEELHLTIGESYYWTDSQIVLHYLRNEKRRFSTYVSNRVAEIRENTLPSQWRHVPGNLNPADDVSRGLSAAELTRDQRWLGGPEFLLLTPSEWPHSKNEEVPDAELEIKKDCRLHCTEVQPADTVEGLAASNEEPPELPKKAPLQQLIDHCSDWTKLRRMVAWLQRFICFIKDGKATSNKMLTVDDYDKATVAIARYIQKSAYEREILDVKKQGCVRSSSKIAALNPTIDNLGVLRVCGRAQAVSTTHTAGRQIILPKDHPVTVLIVRHIHRRMGHLGREHVIAALRENFWIPRVRVLVRSVINRCLTCKKLNARPMFQLMAPLPKGRMMVYEPPFTYTGMDLFGPLYVKHGRSGSAKRWCCLFTCLTTRGVHLEILNSMDTDDFIMSLRRFINRRGEVKELRCDNGSNFVGAERELRESMKEWNQEQINRELIQHGCKWLFQPPAASSMSGVWERMVRSAKVVLKSILGSHVVTDVVLQTVTTEVERILNGRALTANSDSPDDLEPLTPAHFLMQRKCISLPPGVFDNTDMYRKKWRQVQFLTDLFWKRWLKEYLPLLQPRGKWRKAIPNLKPNALVLMVDDNQPRGRWNVGRVLEVFPGPDGLVRTARVKNKDGIYVRPIQKLCLLENDINIS